MAILPFFEKALHRTKISISRQPRRAYKNKLQISKARHHIYFMASESFPCRYEIMPNKSKPWYSQHSLDYWLPGKILWKQRFSQFLFHLNNVCSFFSFRRLSFWPIGLVCVFAGITKINTKMKSTITVGSYDRSSIPVISLTPTFRHHKVWEQVQDIFSFWACYSYFQYFLALLACSRTAWLGYYPVSLPSTGDKTWSGPSTTCECRYTLWTHSHYIKMWNQISKTGTCRDWSSRREIRSLNSNSFHRLSEWLLCFVGLALFIPRTL